MLCCFSSIDAVRDMDGRYLLDKRVKVEISRRGRASREGGGGGRDRDERGAGPVRGPPQRSEHRVKITNLPVLPPYPSPPP